MKTIVATLAAVVCFGIFLLNGSANGDEVTFTLVSSDGSYAPGNFYFVVKFVIQLRSYIEMLICRLHTIMELSI